MKHLWNGAIRNILNSGGLHGRCLSVFISNMPLGRREVEWDTEVDDNGTQLFVIMGQSCL